MTKTLDLITIGRSSVDLYGDQIGGRLEDMGSFSKYIGGSPTNIACGTARLGLKSAVITGVGDEHMGRFIVEQLAREGVDTRGVKVDPERLTALVLLGIRDDERVPADLLPRELRRHGADRGRHRRGLHRRGPRGARHRHPPQPPAHRGGGAEGADPRPQARRAHGARHRLPPEPLGRRRPRRGREPLRRERRGHAEAAGDAAPLRPDRRHRGGVPHRRRLDRHHRGAARGARGLGRDAGLQARRQGRGRLRGRRSPTSLDDGQTGPGFPIEVFNVLGAGDGFFSGLLRGWLTDAGLADEPEVRQRLRRLRGLAPRLHPGLSVAGRARVLPRPRRRPARPPQRRGARAGALGDQPAARAWRRLVGDAGLRLRPPDAARGDGRAPRPRRSAPSSSSACRRRSQVRGRPPRLRHPLRQPPRPRRAARRLRHRPLDRPALRMAGLAAADAGARARQRLRRPERMGARGRGQGALLLPPGRRARDAQPSRRRR